MQICSYKIFKLYSFTCLHVFFLPFKHLKHRRMVSCDLKEVYHKECVRFKILIVKIEAAQADSDSWLVNP